MNESKNREIMEISIEDIVPNRFQPRLTFDTDALNELANSIKEHGIIQPLVVRRLQDKFEIIAGERRYKAASLIGMKKVPCIVMDLNDNESAEVAVIENIQRKEMTPLEEAKSFKKILDKGYLTQEELAKRMGKSQSSIANKLRLLNLDEVVQDAILEGKISERHARSLLKIENKQEQRNVLSEIINKRLTVRQTDDLIKEKYGKGNDIMDNNVVNDNNNQMNIQNPIFSSNMNNYQSQDNTSSIFKEPVVETQNQYQTSPNSQFLSTPEVNIPVTNMSTELNPKLNLMNNNGIFNNQTQIQQATSQNNITPNNSLDIFKYDNPPVQVQKQPDIQSIINPSVFSNNETIPTQNFQNNNLNNVDINTLPENNYQPINNGMNVDINQMKNNAQDIIKKEEPTTNMANLLSVDNKPENKFFIDLDIPEDFNSEPVLPPKVKNAIDLINKQVEELKIQGTNITKQESDLGNTYQIIIRIDK